MKRIYAMFGAALLLMGLAFGCGGQPASAPAAETTTEDYGWLSQLSEQTVTEPVEPTDADPLAPETYTSIVYLTYPPSTKPGAATTTKASTAGGNTVTSTKTTASAATTTKISTTTTGSTKYYANGISIASKDAALSAFNAAVKKVIDSKAGFMKRHLITYKDWAFDQALLDGIPSFGGLFDPASYISGPLNKALGNGTHSATGHKGDSNSLIKNSSFSMGDLKDVTYSGKAGGEWTVTLLVNDGSTRQEKRLFGSGISGNSPIDKGPLNQATGDGGIYDHMSADKVFSLVKSSLSFINADPIDISESTSQVKFTARLDGEGKLVELKATYNQTINLKEIKILNGMDTYKDNTGSSTVTVTYDTFVY